MGLRDVDQVAIQAERQALAQAYRRYIELEGTLTDLAVMNEILRLWPEATSVTLSDVEGMWEHDPSSDPSYSQFVVYNFTLQIYRDSELLATQAYGQGLRNEEDEEDEEVEVLDDDELLSTIWQWFEANEYCAGTIEF